MGKINARCRFRKITRFPRRSARTTQPISNKAFDAMLKEFGLTAESLKAIALSFGVSPSGAESGRFSGDLQAMSVTAILASEWMQFEIRVSAGPDGANGCRNQTV